MYNKATPVLAGALPFTGLASGTMIVCAAMLGLVGAAIFRLAPRQEA